MGEVSTIGIDIAKSVFQVHGVDTDGAVVIRKRIGRTKILKFFTDLPPCLVGMEACATSHHWARELRRLEHDVWLMPPTYVKAYVKRSKNDAADAAAICEAVTRPSMRIVMESCDEKLLSGARFACQAIVMQLHAAQTQINGLDKRIIQAHRVNADSKRLNAIPGFGVILSTAVVATMTDPKAFKTGREFAAWIGLVPRQNSTGGKERLGSISKQGDRYLRRLFVVGAIAIVRTAEVSLGD